MIPTCKKELTEELSPLKTEKEVIRALHKHDCSIIIIQLLGEQRGNEILDELEAEEEKEEENYWWYE